MNNEPEQTDNQFSRTVQSAFVFGARYVHHRNTGGTLMLTRALTEVWPKLSEDIREQILRESHEASANLSDWESFRKLVTTMENSHQ
ncbi:MAG: hypothetical protein CMP14_05905 [Rickettsiales bacterium]|nr:hypothetical protein [Rickettsiales bacterium]